MKAPLRSFASFLLVASFARAQESARVKPSVTILDLIPRSLSSEFQQDSEPFLAISAMNPKLMAASAFTVDPLLGPRAPVFVSADGGRTWAMNAMVPSAAVTADISIGFAGSTLYAGILGVERGKTAKPLKLLRTADLFTRAPMRELMEKVDGSDQPFVFTHAQDPRHFLMMGANVVTSRSSKTATIYRFIDSQGEPPLPWDEVTAEARDTCLQDGPQVRAAISRDGGTAYAAFYQWLSCTRDPENPAFIPIKVNVVLLRDSLTTSATPFSQLSDEEDHVIGLRVAKDRQIAWTMTPDGRFGSERVGGDLAVAVDPNNANVAYLVWSESNEPKKVNPSLHVLKVVEGGKSVAEIAVATIPNAKNPGIAVANDGTVGLLYQSLSPPFFGGEWSTHFRWTRDNFATSHDIVLATFKDGAPSLHAPPYLGDYLNLIAVGDVFQGVFSSSNRPDLSRFYGDATVRYQRNADWNQKVLLAKDGATKIPESIDPFFVEIRLEAVGENTSATSPP